MVWPAVIAAGAQLASTAIGVSGSKQAAKDQRRAANQAAVQSDNAAQQARRDIAPYMSAGYAALAEQRRQLGLGDYAESDIQGANPQLELSGEKMGRKPVYVDKYTGDAYTINEGGAYAGHPVPLGRKVAGYTPQARPQGTAAPTNATGSRYGAFETTPGYLFKLDEGTRAIDRNNAARGRSYSGASLREAARYAAGLASTEYDNYFQRLSQLAGNGQNATGTSINVGQDNANNQGSAALFAGNSRASGVSAQTDMYGNAISNIGGILGDYYANRKPPDSVKGYYNNGITPEQTWMNR